MDEALEKLIDEAKLPTETRADFVRLAALILAKRRLRGVRSNHER